MPLSEVKNIDPSFLRRREILMVSVFWVLVGGLAIFQDYLYSQWRGGYFNIGESLAFKLFWVGFIPMTFLFIFLFRRIQPDSFPLPKRILFYLLLITMACFLHLFLFSVTLSVISGFIHARPWGLTWLFEKKLSTHLVSGLLVYSLMTFIASRYTTVKREISPVRQTIPVRNGSRTILLPTDEIQWITSEGAYLEIHTKDKKYVLISSLKDLLSTLNAEKFKRIHKSAIINIDAVAEIKSRLTGDYDLLTTQGVKLRLSRHYAKEVKNTLT